nr:capsid protein [Rat picobirnavirus]
MANRNKWTARKHAVNKFAQEKKANGKSMENKKAAKKMAAEGNYQDAFADEERAKKFPFKGAMPKQNDPQWYFKSPEVLKDVASYSFSKPLGTLLDITKMYPDQPVYQEPTTIPGVMSITIAPSPGISVDAQSPVNLAAQNIYTRVRYKNSGAANYDPQDLMLYLLAMDSLYSAWNWLKRIYGFASSYSQLNRYRPKAYLLSNNFQPEDIMANLADFRAYLNMAADRISAFCVPAVFTYNVRHSWLFSNVYTDSNTTKAQDYMYIPAFFYKYDETTSSDGGILTPVPVCVVEPSSENHFTFEWARSMLDGMINALQYSEDIGNMSGDILKEFGDGNLFKLSHIDADYKVEPVYSSEVLPQIENCLLLGHQEFVSKTDLSPFNITQDPNTNFIKYQPTWVAPTTPVTRAGTYLNFHWDNPTPENTMLASRLAYNGIYLDGKYYITSCGSEIALEATIWYFSQGRSLTTPANSYSPLGTYYLHLNGMKYPQSFDSDADFVDWVHHTVMTNWLWNSFDWAPMMETAIYPTTGSNLIMPPMRDWDVFTFIDTGDIEAMNLLALLTEFDIPTT